MALGVTAGLTAAFDVPADAPAEAAALEARAGLTAAPGFDGPGFGLAPAVTLGSAILPRPSACSTEARRSTSIRNGCPEEYSA